jgi:pyridoxamine 5'-phosphate oxidase
MTDFPLPGDLTQPQALHRIHASIWDLLETAAKGTGPGWRLPVLATHSREQCFQRTVVLRGVRRSDGVLQFHTDVRSPKVQQIRNNAKVSLLFYDHQLATQLLLQGTAAIHTRGETADQLWADGTTASLKIYCGSAAPGTVSAAPDANLPPQLVGRIPDRNEIEGGRTNFAALEVHTETVEWLRLSRDGNLRARFSPEAGLPLRAEWVAP